MFCIDNSREKIKSLFDGFYDSIMFSYFDGIYGNGFCDNCDRPQTAVIQAGDFYFVAGKIQLQHEIMELVGDNRWAVIVPDTIKWFDALNSKEKPLILVDRFHTCPPTEGFNIEEIQKNVDKICLHKGFKLEKIDEYYYNKALESHWSEFFVNNYKCFDDYSKHGFGYIITKDKEIISGASTYSYYENGVELELATHENYRKMGFASITASSFILECMRRRLIPHWDARNLTSLKIAEKIGFTLRDKYPAFEFEQSCFGK